MIGGDIVNNDGTGNEAETGMVMRDENFLLKHKSKYLLSMLRPKGEHTTGSQFMITLAALPFFDGLQQVIGRVVLSGGLDATIDSIEAVGVATMDGTPSQAVTFDNCVVA